MILKLTERELEREILKQAEGGTVDLMELNHKLTGETGGASGDILDYINASIIKLKNKGYITYITSGVREVSGESESNLTQPGKLYLDTLK